MSDNTLEKYIDDLARDADAMQDQSIEAESDMVFVGVTGGMWEDFIHDTSGERIKMEFNLVAPYVNRKIGQWNQNRVGVEYKSKTLQTTDEDAELLNSIHRADFRENSGKIAVDNAVLEMMRCGYGCFKIFTEFEDEEDADNDLQKISFGPVYNAYQTVFWQNNAKRIDKRDATVCHELIRFTEEAYEEKWPGASFVSAYDPSLTGSANFRTHNSFADLNFIFVSKRYEVVKKRETVYKYFDLQEKKVLKFSEEEHKLKKQELAKNEFIIFRNKRSVLKQHIETTVFNGDEVLEETKRIAGKWIPMVPMYAYRSYVAGEEHYQGLVRFLKDPARAYNTQLSQLVENAAGTGQEIPIFTKEEIEGYEEDWADRNNKPYLRKNEKFDKATGQIIPSTMQYLKPAQLDQSTTTLLQIVPEFIQQITGGAPQDTFDRNMTGKLFRAIQKREDSNTQIIFDNIGSAIQWSGEVYKDMALDGIYTVERMVNLVSPEGAESRKILLQKVNDGKTGLMKTLNDLNNKNFRVYSDIGPMYESAREQTVEELKGMLELLITTGNKADVYITPIISTLIENVTGAGLGPLKKLNRQQMIIQGIIPPETEEEKRQLAEFKQKQDDGDSNKKLIEAAANQANSEARERDSKTLVNTADAKKKEAEAFEIVSKIDVNKAKTMAENTKRLLAVRDSVFENVEALPLAN